MIPGGYVAFGWHTFSSASLSALWQPSRVHLAPADQGDRPYLALCGRRKRSRYAHGDTPATVERELQRGEREKCVSCFAKAGA